MPKVVGLWNSFLRKNFVSIGFRVISRAMENHPATTTASSRSSLARFWPWLMVLIVLLFVGFIRFRLLDMPLERDEGEYAYAGQLILQGIPPYELAYNMKLPGTYYAYAAGMGAFGQTTAGIHLTLIVANSLTIVFIFLLGRKLFDVTVGLVACASYAVLSVSPAVLGMAAHANHFVVLFAVPAVLLLWQAVGTKDRRILFFSGLLFGLAFLMKQQGIFFGLFGGAVLIWHQWKKGNAGNLLKDIFAFGVAMVLPFALVCVILKLSGVFREFWFWTFTYAHAYVAEESWRDGVKNLAGYLKATNRVNAGFLLLALAGLLLPLRNQTMRRPFLCAVLFLGFSFLATATGFYFRRHYFILILPAISILTGLAISEWGKNVRARTTNGGAQLVPLVLFAAILGWSIYFQRDFFFNMSGGEICRTVYRGFPFVEAQVVSGYVAAHSPANARLAVIGSEPEIYFYAHRRSATGYIYTYALMEPQPAAMQMQKEMISEIESNQPEYIIWAGFDNSWLARPSSERAIFDWFNAYAGEFYERVGIADTDAGGKTVYLWDDEAKNYRGTLEQHLDVYKRRPAAN